MQDTTPAVLMQLKLLLLHWLSEWQSGQFKCKCTCAISMFVGTTPEVKVRDRPVPCPGVYRPPRGGRAGWYWGAPGVSTGGGHGYRWRRKCRGGEGYHETVQVKRTTRREQEAGLGSNRLFYLLNPSNWTNVQRRTREHPCTRLPHYFNLSNIWGGKEVKETK